eukprot:NODE_622_length_5328_cov_0.497609.p2 type:complete len:329 gc:universal NODE_622_length_5328_cov_0.497609:422-1408(+)
MWLVKMSNVPNYSLVTDPMLALILYLIYACIGLFFFIYFRNSITIRNRLPKLVLIESLLIILNGSFSILNIHPFLGTRLSCEWFQFIASILGCVLLTFLMMRMSFVYQYLMNEVDIKSYDGLMLISKTFWDKHNNIRKWPIFIIFIVLLIANILNAILPTYAFQQQTGLTVYPFECLQNGVFFLTLYDSILMLLFLAYSFQFIRYRIFDQIYMSVELISFTFVLIGATIIYFALNMHIYIDAAILQCWIGLFFALYFPVLAYLNHMHMIHRELSKSVHSMIDEKLMSLCRQFYCEEIGIFLEAYEKYKVNNITIDYIITMFIGIFIFI